MNVINLSLIKSFQTVTTIMDDLVCDFIQILY
jgi:hypothetical protein